jgi:PhoPQ-activated pathogenicity-related protein
MTKLLKFSLPFLFILLITGFRDVCCGPDSDRDGLCDEEEMGCELDATNQDSDSDGQCDIQDECPLTPGDCPEPKITALDRYIAKPDSAYSYEHYQTIEGQGYTAYLIDLKSQQWRSSQEVDRPIWQHDMAIVVPSICAFKHTAYLLVDGGKNSITRPTSVNDDLAALAVASQSVMIQVRQIPNEPLYFSDEDNHKRSEDEILAYSLDKYLLTSDEEWPAHLPMVKAVVRAMDTAQDFLKADKEIEDFIIMGFSKRGWTTWLTAATDPRVKAIIPGVFDSLNMAASITHHWEAYGFYSPAIEDYAAYDIFCRMNSPAGQELLGMIDPYAYRERLTMPKYIINSTGDQFFLPDSSQFYFHQLPGRHVMRYVPNTEHDIELGIEDIKSILGWTWDVNLDQNDPQFSWSIGQDGSILVIAKDLPTTVKLWQATNPNTRDFRFETIGSAYSSTILEPIDAGIYVGQVTPPTQGWTAFMVELTYTTANSPLSATRTYTTDVKVLPDILPFSGTHCQQPN